MAGSKTVFISYMCMGLMLISHVYHGRLQVEAACPSTADCDECTTEQTACRLCPYDTNIPAGVIDLTILPGMVCPAITRMGLLRDAQFTTLTDIERLTLAGVGLKVTYGQVFKNSPKLKYLSLAYNEIAAIDDQILQGIPALEELNISYNNIASVDPNAFSGLTHLQTVDLSNNKLTTINAADFNGVTIGTLDLSRNPITQIEDGAFAGSKITNLDLSGTQITNVPPSLEQWLQNESTTVKMDSVYNFDCNCDNYWFAMSITGNGPSCSGTSNYPNLPYGIIATQVMKDCTTTTLAPCPNPPECDTCDPLQATCSICPDDPRIPATIKDFTVVQGTCTTSLRSNGQIRDTAFTHYPDLENLNLDDADIMVFIGSVFKNNGNLRTLSMSNGRIRSFPMTLLQNLNKLEDLNVSNNDLLSLVPTQFQGLSSLRTLDLSRNSLPELTNINTANIVGDVFGGLGQLTTLILDSNPITNIDSDIFQPLTSVETISLQNMQLADIRTKLFADLSTLKEIHLANNSISSMADDSFAGTSLDLLDISHNDLNSIPSLALKQSGSFQTLDMSYNKFSQVSAHDFSGVTADKLDLSGNPIAVVEDAAFDNSQITQLDLNSTGLTSLPSSMERWLIHSQVALNLDSNTGWECTCDALWLGRYLSTSTPSKTPTCGAPSAYAGNTLVGALPQMEQDCLTTATTTINKATSVTTDWQTSNTTTTTAPTTSVQRYYQCHVDSVDLAIPVSVVPNSKLHLKESSCQLQNNGTHHVLSFGYHECGTSVAYYTDYIYATNDITVESTLPPNGLVVFADDYTIPLECRFHHEQFVNGAFQAVAIDSTILGRRRGADAADFILREFRTELYQDVITEYPAQIPLNKELFVEIALANANGGTTGIVVKECKATPSNDDNDNTTYTLIQDGCPAQPTVQLQPNPHNEIFRFSLQAFHFADPINQNNMVYLHCDVSICPVTSCTSNCAATKRRRRRSIAQLVDTVTVSSGPYLLV